MAQISQEQQNALVESIYASAVEPKLWPNTLQGIATAFKSEKANLEVRIPKSPQFGFRVSLAADDVYGKPYRQEFWQHNPMQRIWYDIPDGTVVSTDDFSGKNKFKKTVFYGDFYKQFGLYRHMSTQIARIGANSLYSCFHRTQSAGSFDESDLRLMGILSAHIKQAYQVMTRLRQNEELARGALDALSHRSIGSVVVDRTCAVIEHNDEAARIFRQKDALQLAHGRVLLERSNDACLFREAIGWACGEKDRSVRPMQIFVSRHSGKQPYLIEVLPLQSLHNIAPIEQQGALVLITDLAYTADVHSQAFCDAFELTPTEADIAVALARNENPDDIAFSRGITMNTLKTHRRRIYMKTSCRTQADLIELGMKLR